ncbi:MAG: histidine phosphatase family protein [Thermoguttaceae bacterium]
MPPCPAPHSSASNTCWLYLVRHAETDNNRARPRRLQGRRTDPGLSDEGRRQAEAVGRFLAGLPIDAVYVSPLLRARQTAEAIALPHRLSVEVVDDLREVDVGVWDGLDWDEVQRTDPEAYRRFMADASVHPYLGGENLTTVQKRVVPALEKLMARNVGRTVVAVAHNIVNRCCLAHLLHLPLAEFRTIPQENCGINVLRYREGRVKLVSINIAVHLYPDSLHA